MVVPHLQRGRQPVGVCRLRCQGGEGSKEVPFCPMAARCAGTRGSIRVPLVAHVCH